MSHLRVISQEGLESQQQRPGEGSLWMLVTRVTQAWWVLVTQLCDGLRAGQRRPSL